MNFKELFEFNYNNNYFLSYQCVKVKNHLWPTPILILFTTKKVGKTPKTFRFCPRSNEEKMCIFSRDTTKKMFLFPSFDEFFILTKFISK